MSNSLIFVYAPVTGEPFECTPANARDLTSHAGWSYSPLTPATPAAEPVSEETPVTKPRGRRATPVIEEAVVETPAETVTETPAVEEAAAETPAETETLTETETPADAD